MCLPQMAWLVNADRLCGSTDVSVSINKLKKFIYLDSALPI